MKQIITHQLDRLWLAIDLFTERHNKAFLALLLGVSWLISLAKERLGDFWYYALLAGWTVGVLVLLSIVGKQAARVRRQGRNRF